MYLKEFRERLNLTQKELAVKIELTQVSIARYETNKMKPTSAVLEKYITVLNASPNFLFLGIEPHTRIDNRTILEAVLNVVERKKSQEFFKKIYSACEEDGECFRELMNSLLIYIEASEDFQKMNFIEICKLFGSYETKCFGAINVFSIATSINMDEVSGLEILYSLDKLKEIVKEDIG